MTISGFLDRLVRGSVADYVAHNAPCDVLLVRKERETIE